MRVKTTALNNPLTLQPIKWKSVVNPVHSLVSVLQKVSSSVGLLDWCLHLQLESLLIREKKCDDTIFMYFLKKKSCQSHLIIISCSSNNT